MWLQLFLFFMPCPYILGAQIVNPCPNIFKYAQTNSKWFGIVTIPQASVSDNKIVLNISLLVPMVVRDQYVGKVELITTTDQLMDSIENRRPIKFKIYFPLTQTLPSIRRIRINQDILCQAPNQYGLLTEISLTYTVTVQPKVSPSFLSRIDPDPQNGLLNPSIEDVCGTVTAPNVLVMGGNEVSRGEFSWLAVIYIRSSTQLSYLCGGSLISSRHVLTAAHCIKRPYAPQRDKQDLLLSLGRYNLLDWSEIGSVVAEVEAINIHPEYGSKEFYFHNDIAILTMTNSVLFNQFIKPICLKFGGNDSSGFVVGWGQNGTIVSPKPRITKMPIVSQEQCLRSNEAFYYYTSNTTFCAGNQDGTGPCNGDSGTGMYVYNKISRKYYIRGIVSMSLKDPATRSCDLNNFIVFTDLTQFYEWVINIIQN